MMLAAANPFDPRTVLLAKHAQHVVLIHFPIALFIAGVAFEGAALWTRRRGLLDAAYYNFMLAAASTIPVLLTGVLAWQFALEGERLKGILLLHLALGGTSSLLICLVWWLHRQARTRGEALPRYRIIVELPALLLVALTGHLGGFLSGVNQ